MVSSRALRALLLPMAACCVVALCGARALHAQASQGNAQALSIDVPEVLTLGADRDVIVRYRAPVFLDATLYVSIGSLGPAQATGAGSWQVRYSPPSARYPQVAIFALVSRDGSRYRWARVRLRGTATVELSSDPNVQVSVAVAGAKFGPVRTDAAGRAAVPVVVPPGVKVAESSATDALGNVRNHAISLNVPELYPLLCVGAPESSQGFLVFAADSRGKPAVRAPLQTAAQTVTLSRSVAERPGVYRIAFQVPEQVRPGAIAHLDVSLQGSAERASCEIPLMLEPAAKVEVALSRSKYVATEAEPIAIHITPRYSGPGERASALLELSASVGELAQTRVATREPVEIAWRLPHELAGRSQALLHVSGDVKQELAVTLAGGPAVALRARLDRAELPADGHATSALRVSASDSYGNPASVQLTAECLGELSEFRHTGAGEYEADYRALYGETGVDELRVTDRATGLVASTQLQLSPAGGRFALAARAGYLTNFARVSAPLGILQLAYRTPLLGDKLRFSALAGYYQSQASVGTQGSSPPLDVNVWAVPLLLRAEYSLSFGVVDVGPVLGAGMLGAQSRISSTDTGNFYDRHFVLLLAAGAGGAVALGPGRVCAELSYWAASFDKTTISDNAGGVNLSLGYEVSL